MTSRDTIPEVDLSDGRRIPIVGLGTWQMTGDTAYRAVRHALDAGYRHVDTATMYRNEAEVGRAVRDSGVPREQVFVTTKLQPRDAGHERRAITSSLRETGLDYVDLWLVHWPPDGQAGPATWTEFVAAREDGLARSIGVSNYSTPQIDELSERSGVTPVVNQIRWSPARYDAQRLAQLHERGVTPEGYSPFRAGDLADPVLVQIAHDHGVSPAQVVVRWHVEHGVVVIPKSATPERITANADVFGFSLTDDEMAQLDQLSG
ncbi:diketogulonate reductase-like aldo/keto reductase [Haloactinopolyspora alba]|uniref:Diketogulonate reductase-like aldo/keto reductase n=1 Tax=Haloactinopolyspora alba TaxID=648780 RepID=A0A2P8E706_9ACTN|nr:aldo/keto reductase [Haloactinopolyspora alba]PSL05246.1 diketogulonate reductase-like aldo/keto reductase [Haloactinopolyspora alba]